ncbi:HlyC/CorC family transporter [Lachnospiraceae bacterium NSJ-46]|uniref:HlyC/CorC family transporter n=2 Tax=Jingyaoa shaoxingensis TaxID=2763671 RepID=A0ABR7N7D9_9FIRM|nr:HlyC/CorC family transporter [Jingyaoa shaoxingensis]
MERLAQQFGISTPTEEEFQSEIVSMVEEGCQQGIIRSDESEMIKNIFDLASKQAQDVMTHRRHIVGIDCEMTLKDALDFMLNDSHSRFPVYEENMDNVIGILFLKDAMRYMTQKGFADWKIRDIKGLLREAVFIPETKEVTSLFQMMQSQKLQMVIIADEYGQTAGLVAMEDILEVIVGNIQDEYDNDEPLIQKLDQHTYLISGLAPLEQVEEELGTEFGETEFETLNGYLISKLDKIPDEDEHSQIQANGYLFQIEKVANKMIETVKVQRLPEGTNVVKTQE